jgi:octaprenyl-diphosphate synthase
MVALGNMDVMKDMAETTNTVAAGEVLQLVRAGDANTTERQYLDVITRKTAILFASACYGPALLARQDEPVCQALKSFGLNTGIAFQMLDDVLDYEGDPAEMGKNVGDDLAEGKPTLPLIHVMREGSSTQQALVRRAIGDKSAENIEAVIEAVRICGSLDYTRSQAIAYRDRALEQLHLLPDNPCRDSLQAVAELSVQRNH